MIELLKTSLQRLSPNWNASNPLDFGTDCLNDLNLGIDGKMIVSKRIHNRKNKTSNEIDKIIELPNGGIANQTS